MSSGLLACETLDCANKVRIRYRLPRPLALAEAERLPGELEVQEFSRFVSGAKDHIVVRQPGQTRAAGALGDPLLVVTYAKLEGERPAEAIAAYETVLEGLFGPILRRLSGPQADATQPGSPEPGSPQPDVV